MTQESKLARTSYQIMRCIAYKKPKHKVETNQSQEEYCNKITNHIIHIIPAIGK